MKVLVTDTEHEASSEVAGCAGVWTVEQVDEDKLQLTPKIRSRIRARTATDAADDRLVFRWANHASIQSTICSMSTSPCPRVAAGVNADTAGHKRALGIERHHVLVERNVRGPGLVPPPCP